LVLFVLGLCGLGLIQVLIRLASAQLAKKLGLFGALGVVVGGILLLFVALSLYGRWVRWALPRWAERDGWTPVTGRGVWPWTTTEPGVPAPVVRQALSRTIDGFPITVGEVTWGPSGMLDVAGPAKGYGFFAVLRLPRSHPRLGVRRKREPKRPRPGRDEFDRRYWTICADAGTAIDHIGADLKAAHVAKDLPDWIIVEDELYIVTRGRGPLTPSAATGVIRKVSRIADLLRLTRP
jgi:hypothetical protein